MTELLIQYIEQTVEVARVWGPLIIILLMAVESSFIPFPSEVVMIPAGFMAARGELFPGDVVMALTVAVLCGILGSLAGAYVNYWIGLKLGRPFLHRYGRWFFLKPAALERAEEIFREYGAGTTFVCRLIPAIRQLISIPAGLSRMHFGTFTLFTALGAGLWVIVLTMIGYYFGSRFGDITYADLVHRGKDMIHENLIWILLGCAAMFGAYIWIHNRVMRGRRERPAND